MRIKFNLAAVYLMFGLVSCKNQNTKFIKLKASDTQVTFTNELPKNDSLNILDYLYYYNGAGVGVGDFNNDQKVDLFFVSNRGKNTLYMNEGGLKFKDVSAAAGVEGKSNWKTGVAVVDINGDGWQDIYVSVVGNYKGLKGENELYINNQNGTFTEKAAEYGLNFKGFATQSTFFDYDKDGDLDCYVLTHAVHSVSSYDRVSARALRDGEAGDYLYRNDGGKFVDVSAAAGIYGAAMGYGLGIVTADINNDGWDDIYVSNDFHEDDYYYVNQKDGTFKEEVKEHFKHLSKYSMGCDVADVNNDGFVDVFTTDMHPQDETTEKLSLGEDAYDIYQYKLQFGFYNQYSRNCLQISHKGKFFSDISPMAGVSSTDWSWSPLLADFDNDGLKDLFVSNGIPHRPNNMDYIKFLSSGTDSSVLRNIPVFGQKVNDKKAFKEMPNGKVSNYIFRGTNQLKFVDETENWGINEENIANGSAYADLDNDGDLEIITNNLNETAVIYKNQTVEQNQNLKGVLLSLHGSKSNTLGIGTKVFIKTPSNEVKIFQQQPVRGFMSSSDSRMFLGPLHAKDSVFVVWNSGKMQSFSGDQLKGIAEISESDANLDSQTLYESIHAVSPDFEEVANSTLYHKENSDYLDFIREPLIPFLASTEGPKIAVGDVNLDGLQDLYICAGRMKKPQLAIQNTKGGFSISHQPDIEADSVCEDTNAIFADFDNDADLDLYVVSGGNEYLENMPESADRLYLNDGKGQFVKSKNSLPAGINHNKSVAAVCDFDRDGDLDIFVGGRNVSSNYGSVPLSKLLVNNGKAKFAEQKLEELQQVGMVTNASWADLDNDGWQDLVVCGEWMGLITFKNHQGKLERISNGLEKYSGFWHGLLIDDLDHDGHLDILAGNLGTNTKFIKTATPKMKLIANDMDGNGLMEQIVAYEKSSGWYPAATRDDLARMAPGLIAKRFPKYADYAGKTIDKLFTKEELNGPKSVSYEVNCFESMFFKNDGKGNFVAIPLPKEAQISKIYAFTKWGNDIVLGGNLYGVSTYQGRYDASFGLILNFENKQIKVKSPAQSGLILNGQIRDLKIVTLNKKQQLLVARNNDSVQIFNRKE